MRSRYWMCTGRDEDGNDLSFIIVYYDEVELDNGEFYSLCLKGFGCICLQFTALENEKSNWPAATSNDFDDMVNGGGFAVLNETVIPTNLSDDFQKPVKSELCTGDDYDYILIRNYCNQYITLRIPYDTRIDGVTPLVIGGVYMFDFANDANGAYIVERFGYANEDVLIDEMVIPISVSSEQEKIVCSNYKFTRCDGGEDIVSVGLDFDCRDEHDNLVLPTEGKNYRINWVDPDNNDCVICVNYVGVVNERANVETVQCADVPAIAFENCNCNEISGTLEFVDCNSQEHFYWPETWMFPASGFVPGNTYSIGIQTYRCFTYIGISNHEPYYPYMMNKVNSRECVDCDTYFVVDAYSCYDNYEIKIPVIISGTIINALHANGHNTISFEYDGKDFKCVTIGNSRQIDAEEYEELTSGEHILVNGTALEFSSCQECIDNIVDGGNAGVWTITGCDGDVYILVIGTAEYDVYDGRTVLFSIDGLNPKCGTINRVNATDDIQGYENVNVNRIEILGCYKDCQKCHDENCVEKEEEKTVLGFTPDNGYKVNATYDACIKYDVCCEDKNKEL